MCMCVFKAQAYSWGSGRGVPVRLWITRSGAAAATRGGGIMAIAIVGKIVWHPEKGGEQGAVVVV